jgi:hypothetical protein
MPDHRPVRDGAQPTLTADCGSTVPPDDLSLAEVAARLGKKKTWLYETLKNEAARDGTSTSTSSFARR